MLGVEYGEVNCVKLVFVVNVPDFFLSHRLPLALAARDAGYSVQIVTGPGSACEQIRTLGFVHHCLPISRSGTKPWKELYSLWSLWRLLHWLKPDLLHLVTIKPVLYGGLMARLAGVPAVVAAISGLGSVFVTRSGSTQWLRYGVELLYRVALGHPHLRAIFQNRDDQAMLVGLGAVRHGQSILVRGSGVSLTDYPVKPEPEGKPVVTFASRLLREKGVFEFVEAARILKERGVQSRFWLVGEPDPGNPSSISYEDVERWQEEGVVEPLGYRTDIADVFAHSNLVVLPSYREGFPKVLIEAAACGRAIITTDVPGCRDAIELNVTGLLVPVRDVAALADAIERLLSDVELRQSMGAAGRKLAEREFGIENVVGAHLKIYQELLDAC
jgi:glycosyltransferase involved in cell wall biosynthesis